MAGGKWYRQHTGTHVKDDSGKIYGPGAEFQCEVDLCAMFNRPGSIKFSEIPAPDVPMENVVVQMPSSDAAPVAPTSPPRPTPTPPTPQPSPQPTRK